MANRNRLVILAAAAAALGCAQQGKVAGPIAGYVFDGVAHGVRPVLGIPGASIFGDALPLGYDVASATVSPGADSAVVTAADGSLHLVRLSAGQASEVTLNGATVKPDRVVFSPSGTAVALVGAGRAQIFSGLPDAPTLAKTLDFGGAASAQVSTQAAQRRPNTVAGAMALSDDGALLLAADGGSVRLLGAGAAHSFDTAGRDTVVAFAAGNHDAVLATRYSATVIRGIDSTMNQQSLTPAAPLDNAGGVAFSADGKSLFLAGGSGVKVFDLATGTPAAVSCNCMPTRLERMGSVYRLNDAGSGPLWLLDLAGTPRIVFVPAGVSE
jgi:DNA-binding beta-propeller fold protein YncE